MGSVQWPTHAPSSPPWASRDPVGIPRLPSRGPGKLKIKGVSSTRDDSLRKAKYGVGMLAGFFVVHAAKKLITSLPLLGSITRPVLALLPTVVVGPALGAAAVYGIEEGDILAARHIVRRRGSAAKREVKTIARDLQAEAREAGRRVSKQLEAHQDVIDSTARVAQRSVRELERTVVPVLVAEYKNVEAHARKAFESASAKDNNGSAGGRR